MLNVWNGVGRLTDDIVLRQTQSGVSVTSFTVAINRKYDKEKSDFINCVAYGKTAEFMDRYLGKGLLIAVEGEIQTRNYEKDGRKVYVTEVYASSVQAIEWKREEQPQFEPKNEYQPTNQASDQASDQASEDLPF